MIKDIDLPNLLFFKKLKGEKNISHFSTTRNGGVSSGEFESLNLGNYSDDSPLNIYDNRNIVARQFHVETNSLITPHQTHGSNVVHIDSKFLRLSKTDQVNKLYGFDASITNERGIFLCVTTADCVPILLYDSKNEATAAIHAGWKGTCGRIIQNTIQEMGKLFGTIPSDIIAGIGPSISMINYEIGNDVKKEFTKNGFTIDLSNSFINKDTAKIHIDLKEINRQELIRLGLQEINIEKTDYCTFDNKDIFFSARRQSIHSGRMLTGIMIHH